MCASLLSRMWSVRIHGNDISMGNYPQSGRGKRRKREGQRCKGRDKRGEGEGMEGEGQGMEGERAWKGREGMRGEHSEQTRVVHSHSYYNISVSFKNYNNDPRDLWKRLPTRVVKHSSDQNHQWHQNIPGSFHPWSVPERTP